MQLMYAILADAAEISPSGKFSMLGGGVETLSAAGFPVGVPYLALLIRLALSDDEVGKAHRFRCRLITPDGEDLFTQPQDAPFVAQPHHLKLDLPVQYVFIIGLSGLVFPKPGKYLFHMLGDDVLLGTRPIYLLHTQTTEATTSERKGT